MTTATACFADWDQLESRHEFHIGADRRRVDRAALPLPAFWHDCCNDWLWATLGGSGLSRFGVWREIVIGFGLLIAIDGCVAFGRNGWRENADRWPLLLLPSLIGAVDPSSGCLANGAPRLDRKRLGKQRGTSHDPASLFRPPFHHGFVLISGRAVFACWSSSDQW